MARHFPNWITAYEEYTQHSEAPLAFHRWTAIATIAGALRRRVRLEMGYFRWFPNFFLCFVAPPGIVSKSTTADIGMALLRRVPGIKFGPGAITWQALITSLVESREDFAMPDGTFMPMCAITVVASELGTFIQPGDQSMLNALTHLWDGQDDPFRKRTKHDGEEIVANPWINLVGCTTPAWIAENFNNYFIGGGFASRTLFIFAEHKRQLVAYPAAKISSKQAQLGDRLVADLEQIAGLCGNYVLSPDAIRWGEDWYARHHSSDNPLRLDPRSGGYFARKQTHVHKTAMVLAACQGNSLTIERHHLEQAVEWVTELEPNMLAVFGEMGKEKITDQMAQILKHIREVGRVRRPDLYSKFITQMGYPTFNDCVTGLQQAGLIELVQDAQGFVVKYLGQQIEMKLEAKK